MSGRRQWECWWPVWLRDEKRVAWPGETVWWEPVPWLDFPSPGLFLLEGGVFPVYDYYGKESP